MKTILLVALALAATVSAAAMFSKQPQDVAVAPDAAAACRQLALDAPVAAASRPSGCSPVGETFAAANLSDGQSVRAVVSNVLAPAAGTTVTACPVVVQFFRGDGSLVGSPESLSLNPGVSASVPAASSKSAMVRADFAVLADPSDPTKPGDPNGICAIRSAQEVFDVSTGKTISVNPSATCIGNGVSAGFTRPCA
jgi:hypothetical protein